MKTLDIIVDGVVCGHTTEEGITIDTSMVIKNWWPGWIPIEERLPEQDLWVLCLMDEPGEPDVWHGYTIGCYNHVNKEWNLECANTYDDIEFCSTYEYHVTHWMPLPNPPKA